MFQVCLLRNHWLVFVTGSDPFLSFQQYHNWHPLAVMYRLIILWDSHGWILTKVKQKLVRKTWLANYDESSLDTFEYRDNFRILVVLSMKPLVSNNNHVSLLLIEIQIRSNTQQLLENRIWFRLSTTDQVVGKITCLSAKHDSVTLLLMK